MKSISNEELKKIELDILITVTDFCDKNNLQYFLGYGTLLGAVRHKGFIPWDDDIDIFMPRDDYNVLIKIFNDKMCKTPYRAIIPHSKYAKHTILKIGDSRTLKSEPEYRYTNTTKSGMIDIDVFPLDGTPENDTLYDEWYNKLFSLYHAYFLKIRTFKNINLREKIKLLIKKVLYIFLSKKKIQKNTTQLHAAFPYSSCKYIGCIECCWNPKNTRFNKDYFSDFTLLEFCGHKFKAPINYDEVLKNLYNNYMQLPPEKDRVPQHKMNIFWNL